MSGVLKRLAIALLVLTGLGGSGQAVSKVPIEDAKAIVCSRVAELQAALGPQLEGRVTMAVGMTEEGTIIVATSENDRAKLRDPLASLIRPGDVVLTNQYARSQPRLHAEEKIVRYAGTSLVVVAAGRAICELCESAIRSLHAVPVTDCRSVKPRKRD